jgi:hypothetical protein
VRFGEEVLYLKETITVQRRSDDYMAYVTGSACLWAAGDSAREAIGNLVMTHPDRIVQALERRP